MNDRNKLPKAAAEVLAKFEERSRLSSLATDLKERSDGPLLIILLGAPNERAYRALNEVLAGLPDDHEFKERVTLGRRAPQSWIDSPESRLLQQVLSESLTVDQHSFEEDFFDRYIRSVTGAEDQIVTDSNHIVFGRRGSGKSSLLAYAMRKRRAVNAPYAWLSLQTYERRNDPAVIAGVLLEIVDAVRRDLPREATAFQHARQAIAQMLERPQTVELGNLRLVLPELKQAFSRVTSRHGRFTIFLDDFHLIEQDLQPEFLASLYSFARGNKVFLKLSAIEQFTRVWDPTKRAGLEVPNDAQVLRLDYNLTRPDKSLEHITSILTTHARYCGLPSVNSICARGALARLVWVAAGVPRDAIYIFSQAMVRALTEGEREVSVTSINISASHIADDKMRFVEMDSSGGAQGALKTLESIKRFCIEGQKKNAFLAEIQNNDPAFESIRKLIDLRFLHVLNPGITPDRAGVRWMALLLDYGFYTGIRASKGIDLFQSDPKTPEVKELRKLPRLRLDVGDPRPKVPQSPKNGRRSATAASPKKPRRKVAPGRRAG